MFALKQYAETQLEENLSLSRHVLSRINIKIRWFRNDFLSTITNYIWQKICRIEMFEKVQENRYSSGIFLHNEYPEVEHKPCFHDI